MTEFICIRCGWCCMHVKFPCTKRLKYHKSVWEWLKVRGIEIRNGWMIVPSTCQYLGAEELPDGNWVTKCNLQECKPVECKKAGCTKI
jgi:hypothetical protein